MCLRSCPARTIKHVPALQQTAVSFHTPYSVNEKSSLLLCLSYRDHNLLFQQQYAREMHQWQSFLHCGQCPVVLVRCLLVAVTKFQDKFASLRQGNSSNRAFAWRPCCMPGTIKMFCIRMNILFHRNNIVLFLACNMAAMQNLYSQDKFQKCCTNMYLVEF